MLGQIQFVLTNKFITQCTRKNTIRYTVVWVENHFFRKLILKNCLKKCLLKLTESNCCGRLSCAKHCC